MVLISFSYKQNLELLAEALIIEGQSLRTEDRPHSRELDRDRYRFAQRHRDSTHCRYA
ncbi:hypothetical protein SAMN03159495_3277 [Pseudomonas sp. NFR16]|nr:hypothetical protein SAMN03159495_3277 [Pseudomonas sp. NFR16]